MSSQQGTLDFTQFQDFRDILKEEFQHRSNKNSRYTLGAFSKHLGVSPSRMHEILAGRYGISSAVAKDLAQKLKFSDFKTQYFCNLVESQHGRSEINKKLALLRLLELKERSKFDKVSLDIFEAISNWYYFAILELTAVVDFNPNALWIAGKLGLPLPEVQAAVDRLLRLNLLEQKDGTLRATNDYSLVGDDLPSLAIKNYHAQIMQKAQEALVSQPLDKREFLSLTLAIDDEKIIEAKAMLLEFQKKFCKTMSDSELKKKVYCLSLQFFNMEGNNEKNNP